MKLSEAYTGSALPQRVAVVGLPGSGKTTLAMGLASMYKLHWIDIENGAETLLKLTPAQQNNIDLIKLPDSASYPIAADTLAQLFRAGKASICHTHGKVSCSLCSAKAKSVPDSPDLFDHIDFSALDSNDIVVIDSGTQWSNSILAHIMKSKPVDAKPERDDWGSLRKHTEFALSQMQAASFNLVVIFHAQEAPMEDGKTKLVPTFGSAAMSTEVAKAFGHVVYCDVRNRKHVAFSSSTALPNVLTKSRTDFEIEKLAVPSLLPIFNAPGFSAAAHNQEELSKLIPAVVTTADVPTPAQPDPITLSPAAQALANLRAKKAEAEAATHTPTTTQQEKQQ